jgi:pyridoxine 5'-phosphate synthase PdxJ
MKRTIKMAVAKKKPIVEKATGEKYANKKVMAKHEKSESKAERMKEYGKAGVKKGKR